ncbi:hypothetical protein HDU98_000002 [Podochytrium sp. JEL0797]|nr:hypothetical protein HDU98_000002 [Podochytrium sp. JEL0797]
MQTPDLVDRVLIASADVDSEARVVVDDAAQVRISTDSTDSTDSYLSWVQQARTENETTRSKSITSNVSSVFSWLDNGLKEAVAGLLLGNEKRGFSDVRKASGKNQKHLKRRWAEPTNVDEIIANMDSVLSVWSHETVSTDNRVVASADETEWIDDQDELPRLSTSSEAPNPYFDINEVPLRISSDSSASRFSYLSWGKSDKKRMTTFSLASSVSSYRSWVDKTKTSVKAGLPSIMSSVSSTSFRMKRREPATFREVRERAKKRSRGHRSRRWVR